MTLAAPFAGRGQFLFVRGGRPAGVLARGDRGAIVRRYVLLVLAALVGLGLPLRADAQFRVVTYNTTGAPLADMNIVLRSIGEELRNGVAKPIDVLLLQEQENSPAGFGQISTDTQAFVTLLNSMYSGQGVSYAMSNFNGAGDTTQTVVYRTQTMQLVGQSTVGTASFDGTGQPRQTMRYQMRPVGYDSVADFYVYNSHYKSSDTTTDRERRNIEATAVRANADALGQGAHLIYAGDFNLYRSTEAAFQTLISAGAGQAFDPINRVGTWTNNASYADVHTQSPCLSGCVGISGGMDDRFDFQLSTAEFQDGEGLSYMSGSYHTFGNNGSTFNKDVNDPTNTIVFNGVTSHTKTQILDALWSVTDHLPVVADYQLPAKMDVQVASIPLTVTLGSSVLVDVDVTNLFPGAQTVNSVDELDYTLTTTGAISIPGDLDGIFMDTNPVNSGPHTTQISLDTSTPGVKNGLLSVLATSPQAKSLQGTNGLYTLNVSYTVLGPSYLEADFNEDGEVDSFDLVAWQMNAGLASGAMKNQGDANADGMVDGVDLLVWQEQLGSPPPAVGALAAVPEPSSGVLLAICATGLTAMARQAAATRRGRG
jgi:endonuclease/exonuclease/phosphatase family metal-dependent hydrolase